MPNDLIPPSPHYADTDPHAPDDTAFFALSDPDALFAEWLDAAGTSEPNDPNAMALATIDAAGLPDVRMVLLKAVDARGFSFYTSAESAKGEALAAHSSAALCFHWKSLRRQVRVRGPVERVSAQEADEYFATRDRGARLSAWASRQSRPMESRAAFEARVQEFDQRFSGQDVPRPAYWIGYRLVPLSIEFWRDRPFRMHDRLVFHRNAPEDSWAKSRLYP